MAKSPLQNRLNQFLNHHWEASDVFIFLCWILIGINLWTSLQDQIRIVRQRRKNPYVFWGIKYSGLAPFLKGQKSIGFYTDKNMDDRFNALLFSQAQYVLAPVILDLNNTRREFVVFDCSTPQAAVKKMKEIKAVPLRANALGVILARKIPENVPAEFLKTRFPPDSP